MSGGSVKALLLLTIFCLWKNTFVVDALHEDVVDGILAKVSLDFLKVDTELEDFSIKTNKRLGEVDTAIYTNLLMGRLVLEELTRSSNVTYTENGDGSPVSFEFTAQLKAFFAYKYRLSVSTTTWGFGNSVGNWLSSVRVLMELGPEDCLLGLAKAQRNTASFEVDIQPADNFLFPATLHLPAGNRLEKHLDRYVNNVFQTVFTGRKICDCISC